MKKSYRLFSHILCVILAAAFTLSCEKNNPDPIDPEKPEEEIKEEPKPKKEIVIADLEKMTLREKIGQMFFIRPESLFKQYNENMDYNKVPTHDKLTSEQIAQFANYPCGGVIIYADNISSPAQLGQFQDDIHRLGNYPLLCIDEEGGAVARIGNKILFGVPTFTSMGSIGATKDYSKAYGAGDVIGTYLYKYGIDVNFAPVADVNSNSNNPVIGTRSFSSDPEVAAGMVSQFLVGMQKKNVTGCLKHFPGHGDTKTDSHYGYAETQKSWEQMKECEMIPFKSGIEAGAKMIMTAHIGAPNVTGSDIPATMSEYILKAKLRNELGFTGIIVTDGMEMGAITKQYSAEEAAIGVVKAGVDIILGPENYFKAFDALYDAVKSGDIPESRIDESVARILTLKKEMFDARKEMFK